MMEQLLAEDVEEKKAKGAAKSAKSKKARKKRGEPAVATSTGTGHELEARDTGVKATVEDSGEAPQEDLETMPVAPSPDPAAAHPTAPEPVVPSTEARTAAPAPVDTGAAATPAKTRPVPASSVGAQPARGTGRGGRGLNGRGRWKGRGVQRVGSAAVAHQLGQASLQVPEDLPDAGAAAPVTVTAPVALDTPPPPPADITSLADAQFSTGRPEAPESTIGGQTTCIVCFVNPKSHAAVPCGHWCTCGEECSAQMQACPVCRGPVQM